jgi:hypothetical protein
MNEVVHATPLASARFFSIAVPGILVPDTTLGASSF